ncbi:aconitase family protein [Escherichia coli]
MTPLRRGCHLLCHKISPLLSIWVVIKSLRDVCVIFNIHPEENQGFATLSLREELCRQPYEKPVRTRCRPKIKLTTTTALPLAAKSLGDITRLPKSLKVLLENPLRWQDGNSVTEEDIHALAGWLKNAHADREIAYRPARVLMQDFTGVPAVVDLAAMREAVKRLGGDTAKVNPLSPVDLGH